MKKLWPEKLKYHERDGCQNCVTNQNEAIDQCRKAVEEALSETHVKQVSELTATAIRQHLIDRLFGKQNNKGNENDEY